MKSAYLEARKNSEKLVTAAKTSIKKDAGDTKGSSETQFRPWPSDLFEFQKGRNNRGLSKTLFTVRAYLLDPAKAENKDDLPQTLALGSRELEGEPFKGLIRVSKINAQRGFADAEGDGTKEEDYSKEVTHSGTKKLSAQLRSYYGAHLNPTKAPSEKDVKALWAIAEAQTTFDQQLQEGFADRVKELKKFGYPGLADPELQLSSKIKPVELLSHDAAVQYKVGGATADSPYLLPEQYNGLGYQNLISMTFGLMRYRDEWLKIGNAAWSEDGSTKEDVSPEPLLLVLVEEPEAHLHAQVQQVFIRNAYSVLRNNPDLGKKETLSTQLIVSTHSSHIAHAADFTCLRYFRRRPPKAPADVPTSMVVNLSAVFGGQDDTTRFVKRYLKATHCDLFFADAAIFVEGSAERILVPQFIEKTYPVLNQRYVTLLEVGGSHAQTFQTLLEKLGLITLIISDLDAAMRTKEDGKPSSAQPCLGHNQVTTNPVLRLWHPKISNIDDLCKVEPSALEMTTEDTCPLFVTFQRPIDLTFKSKEGKVLASTFEDALAFENLDVISKSKSVGLMRKFNDAISKATTLEELSESFYGEVRAGGSKAEFALELLFLPEDAVLTPPSYIRDGLEWLQDQLEKRKTDLPVGGPSK